MTEVPEENRAEETLADGPGPSGVPDPEEYEAEENVAVSPETGTVYDGTGEPDHTPHDDELEDGAP